MFEVLKDVYHTLVWPPAPTFKKEDYPDLTGTVAFVSGCSAGIGVPLVKNLLAKNCHVIAGVRNKSKMEGVAQKIVTELGDNDGSPVGKLDIVVIDLMDLETLKSVPSQLEKFTDHLDIIIHNAAISVSTSKETKQGFNPIFGVNVFNTFLLQRYLDPFFLKDSDSPFKRLVWVASALHLFTPKGGFNWELSRGPSRGLGDDMDAYNESKTLVMWLAYYWNVIHKEDIEKNEKIVSLSAHPGMIASDLYKEGNALMRYLQSWLYSVESGSLSILYGALSPDLNSKEHQGAYICPWGRVYPPRLDVKEGFTNGQAEKMWNYVLSTTEPYLN